MPHPLPAVLRRFFQRKTTLLSQEPLFQDPPPRAMFNLPWYSQSAIQWCYPSELLQNHGHTSPSPRWNGEWDPSTVSKALLVTSLTYPEQGLSLLAFKAWTQSHAMPWPGMHLPAFRHHPPWMSRWQWQCGYWADPDSWKLCPCASQCDQPPASSRGAVQRISSGS